MIVRTLLILSLTFSTLGCKIQEYCTSDYCVMEGETLEQIGIY